MKKFLTILMLVYGVLAIVPAEAQIFIEEGKVTATVKPGGTFGGDIAVNNTTNKELKVKIYWEDFQYKPPFDGAKNFLPAGTSSYALAKWIQFSPREAVIPPFGKTRISYTLRLPTFAKGGYYGVLFVEPETPEIKAEKGLKIVSRVGSLFFIESENKIKKAVLDGLAFSGSTLNGKMVNQGNVILLPKGTYYIMDAQGVVADRGEIKALYLPPGETAEVEVPLKSDFSAGEYTLVMNFDLDGGDVIVKEVDFTKNSDSDYTIKAVRD